MLVIWQILASTLHFHYFPTIDAIVSSFINDIGSGEILSDVIVSFSRCLIGLGCSILVGISVGTAIGMNNYIKQLFMPTINGIRSMPITALIPLIIMAFGMTETATFVVLLLTATIPVLITTIDGISAANKKYYPLIANLELGNFKAITKVLLPASMPSIMSGIDISVNAGFKMLILAELMGTNAGIGFRLMEASHYLEYTKVYYLLFVISVMGITVTSIHNLLKDRVLKWV